MGGFSSLYVSPEIAYMVKKFRLVDHDWIIEYGPRVEFPNSVIVGPSDNWAAMQLGILARTEKQYLDASVRYWSNTELVAGVMLRYQGSGGSFYQHVTDIPADMADSHADKYVAGSWTTLVVRSANHDPSWWIEYVFSVSGSTVKFFQWGGWFSATDTSITSAGYAGLRSTGKSKLLPTQIGPPQSTPLRPLAYFEVPVIGSGSEKDPFRAQMPEQIIDGVNILALSHSSLIKSGSDGKPVDYVAIVRVFDQPDRDPGLAPISKALEALKAIQGVRQLTREQAIAQAKRLDDKLTDLDLLSASELRKDPRAAAKEYKQWRVGSLGVKEELIDDSIQELYAQEDKGW